MLRVSVQHNRVVLRDVDLGERFADLHADVAVDKYGRVQLLTEKMKFYCSLDSLGNDVLEAIRDILSKDESLARPFRKIGRKIDRHLAGEVAQLTAEVL
jgi:hypothetical protein